MNAWSVKMIESYRGQPAFIYVKKIRFRILNKLILVWNVKNFSINYNLIKISLINVINKHALSVYYLVVNVNIIAKPVSSVIMR